ncbi:hypothetical protein BHM03_00046091 [Ensete ventricosum]|nr:hypothetical protein BHM03_00046091 [Ensete ventricosum]
MAAARREIVLFFFTSFLSCPFFSGNSNVKSAKRRRIERVQKRGETKQGKGGSLIPVPRRITHVGGGVADRAVPPSYDQKTRRSEPPKAVRIDQRRKFFGIGCLGIDRSRETKQGMERRR